MMDAKTGLLIALGAFTLFYLVVFIRGVTARARETGESPTPTPWGLVVGFVTNFFDTLGVGSFATTTSIFRAWKMVPDEKIPGTLNVGHTLATIAQAYIFTKLVPVESKTLILMILAAVAGSYLGAGIVSGWSRRKVQIGMGLALTGAAIVMLLRLIEFIPGGGEATGLSGGLLAAGLAGNFALGALMTLGIGLYAPCMILVSFLGMNQVTAFPIMMGSCAFLMPIASARFIKAKAFDVRAVLGLAIGGLPAAIIAGLFVVSLPLDIVKGIVIVVVLYTAATMLMAAHREKQLNP
jgi:uncharacterized membrane protein YfcA